jgi:hypothetical protein
VRSPTSLPQQSSQSLLVGEATVTVAQLQRPGGVDVNLFRGTAAPDVVQVRAHMAMSCDLTCCGAMTSLDDIAHLQCVYL